MRVDGARLLTDLPLQLAVQPDVVIAAEDDGDGAIPAELRQWLVRLRLLDGVPFAYLVADSELLPHESIRWFYVDRRWTDALVQGALAVGTVNSDDRTALTARYESVRDELDAEERNYRRAPGSSRYSGEGGPISGFLLRSAAVSGWPGLHVRGFATEPTGGDAARVPSVDAEPMRLLRLERLAPAVLLCLFDGIPKVVHVEEPRQGVQFGFDSARRRPVHRDAETAQRDDVRLPAGGTDHGAVPHRRGRCRRHPGTRTPTRPASRQRRGRRAGQLGVRVAVDPFPVPPGVR